MTPTIAAAVGVEIAEAFATIAVAPAVGGDGDPFSMFAGPGRQMAFLLMLVGAAVIVFWYGAKQFGKQRGAGSLRPQGRVLREFRRMRPAQWRQEIARLETRPATSIDHAAAGPVRVEGVLTSAPENLGGPPGRECVWRNRQGARPQSAIAAELVFMADATGKCALEGLDAAHVIAPADPLGLHHESVSLYLGDRVEVFGIFAPERVTDRENPAGTVYGTLTAPGGLEVRLLQRPVRDPAPDQEPSEDAP